MPKYYHRGEDAPVTVEDGSSSVARTAITAVSAVIIVALIIWALIYGFNHMPKAAEKKVDVNVTLPVNR